VEKGGEVVNKGRKIRRGMGGQNRRWVSK